MATTRAQFFDGESGVRHMDESRVILRLSEIENLYHRGASRPSNLELHTSLFTGALLPPTPVTGSEDPYSLDIQIEELLNVLSSAAFIDFGVVEMRIRLGQILWGTRNFVDEDDISINGELENISANERNWLLLQIMLSCELLIRLDIVVNEADDSIPADLFNSRASSSVQWGILVARTWLENIRVIIPELDPEPGPVKKGGGWLASFTGNDKATDDSENSLAERATFEPRHADIQLSGLIQFAKNLRWGNIKGLSSRCLSVCSFFVFLKKIFKASYLSWH